MVNDCLEQTLKIIKDAKGTIAGMIIEPVQCEGGDRHGTPYFFQQLQKMCKENNITFIVDEVQTGGGATGKWWGFEHFDLPESPDIVGWSKKLQSAGFYYRSELFPPQPYRIFNTWMGSIPTMLQTKTIIQVVTE
jgi:4-aminobutyrate aminotransferase / (S)-3-amino-2-methylpropionate transaminase